MRSGTSRYARLIVVTAALAIATIGLPGSTASATHGGDHATAVLIDADGDAIGRANFEQHGDPAPGDPAADAGAPLVFVDVQLSDSGLTAGFHGFHIHADDDPSNGDGCVAGLANDFLSVDGHYNPDGDTHGSHAGDLPVLHVNADGSARKVFATTAFSVDEITGRALIVHAQPDNYANVPDERPDGTGYEQNDGDGPVPDEQTLGTGDAGARVACGDIIGEEGPALAEPAFEDESAAFFTDTAGTFVGASFLAEESALPGVGLVTSTDLVGDPGFHGFHLHAGNRCQFAAGSYDFAYAKGHYDPAGTDHGEHAGDLPVLYMNPETTTVSDGETVDIEGSLQGDVLDRFTLEETRGKALIIHANADNYANIPDTRDDGTGYEQNDGEGPVPDEATLAGADSGARLACAMVEGLVRLGGFDRMDTAVAISQDSFLTDASAPAAVLARADKFPDALAGAPLAEAVDAPMLLTPPGDLDADTAAELQRVLPPGATVYLLGGPVALDPAVEQAVEDLGFDTVRLAGPTRFETAVEIAEQLDSSHDRIFVTTGVRWPDAVSAGGAAAHHDAVILFSAGEGPHATTDAYLADHQGESTFAIGGPAARAYPEATAVFGADRNETSVAVAEEFFPDGPTYVGLARDGEFGDDLDDRFADALTGGVHVGRLGGTVLLVHEEQLPDSVRDYLQANAGAVIREYAYGGPIAISQETATAAENAANEGAQASAQGSERFEGMGTSDLLDRLVR